MIINLHNAPHCKLAILLKHRQLRAVPSDLGCSLATEANGGCDGSLSRPVAASAVLGHGSFFFTFHPYGVSNLNGSCRFMLPREYHHKHGG